jgi:hypothetical protein
LRIFNTTDSLVLTGGGGRGGSGNLDVAQRADFLLSAGGGDDVSLSWTTSSFDSSMTCFVDHKVWLENIVESSAIMKVDTLSSGFAVSVLVLTLLVLTTLEVEDADGKHSIAWWGRTFTITLSAFLFDIYTVGGEDKPKVYETIIWSIQHSLK